MEELDNIVYRENGKGPSNLGYQAGLRQSNFNRDPNDGHQKKPNLKMTNDKAQMSNQAQKPKI